jgi:hypothetical protein
LLLADGLDHRWKLRSSGRNEHWNWKEMAKYKRLAHDYFTK